MKSKENNIGETVPKSNRKIVVPEVKLTLLHFSDLVQTDNKSYGCKHPFSEFFGGVCVAYLFSFAFVLFYYVSLSSEFRVVMSATMST